MVDRVEDDGVGGVLGQFGPGAQAGVSVAFGGAAAFPLRLLVQPKTTEASADSDARAKLC